MSNVIDLPVGDNRTSCAPPFNETPRVPRNDAELNELLEQTQRLLDWRNSERFAGQSGAQIATAAEKRGCVAEISHDDSLPGGFRIRFVPRHVPAYLDPEQPGLLRKQAD